MTVRMLLPMERKDLAAHLIRLEGRDRTMRFESAMGDASITRYVDGIDMRRDAVFGYFDDQCVLRGAAHVAIANDLADLGLSVEAGHRGQGHGGRLLDRAMDWSRFRAARFSSQCLTRNRWMMGRMRDMGCAIERDHETAVATMALEPADIPLACRTMMREQAGWIAYGTQAWLANIGKGIHARA